MKENQEIYKSLLEVFSDEWILGKTPDFQIILPDKVLHISKGKIKQIEHPEGSIFKIELLDNPVLQGYLDLSTVSPSAPC